MGDLTRGQLLTQAGLAAGDDTVLSFARTWLDAWLKRTSKSWSWPLSKARVYDHPISVGVASVGVGVGYTTRIGNGSSTLFHIHRLLGGYVLWRSAAGFTPRGRMLVRQLLVGDPDTDENTTDPLLRKGSPETVKVRQGADGSLTLFPNPTPDRDMLLSMDVHVVPNSLTSGLAGDVEVPWYPNDKTLLQACKCAILEYNTSAEKSQLFDDEMAKLAAMVVDDRDFDGEQAGDNEVMAYDPSVFR